MSSPSRLGRAGWVGSECGEFYARQFLPNIPPDFDLTSLSQTFGSDRIVEEFVIRFTHTLDMDWMLPGVRATGRRVEFALAGIIQFDAGKVAHEHLYWDQATVLAQLGVLDDPLAAAGIGSARSFCNFGTSTVAIRPPPDLRLRPKLAQCAPIAAY